VDPIHKVRFIRKDYQRDRNMSFWIHGDAAWGGYVRSLFMGHESPEPSGGELPELNRFYHRAMGMSEEIELRLEHPSDGRTTEQVRKVQIDWNDLEVYSAYLALGSADSITIDPHKLGFVPYPAGIVAFRRELVTDLIVQRAQYISEDAAGIDGIEQDIDVVRVGPYILEGSKPGAAAASCWLAHKTIPLDKDGHGKIIRESMLNTKKLARYVSMHHKIFDSVELGFQGRPEQRFSFELVAEPDTNIVCFVCIPLKGDGYEFDDSWSLDRINRFNLAIYERATIRNPPHVHKTPYAQEFFVSRTVLTTDQYRKSSVKGLLGRFRWSEEEYEEHGIFVLRSTVMNPWHRLAEEKGKNYLFDFVVDLHRIAREEVGRV
jgi:glutamate/tyrosine decarboxylase-like PLP-dependent enzyme